MVRFLGTLRTAGVRISVAEGLDAMLAAEMVGYEDRQLLKDALGLTVAKSSEEKALFEVCFDDFFRRDEFKKVEAQEGEGEESREPGEAGESSTALGQKLLGGDRAALAQ